MDKSQTGLAGAFSTLGQLTRKGLVAPLTLGNTKGVDILVTNKDLNRLYKVEVKASTSKPNKDRLFGDGYFYSWAMSKKHEQLIDKHLKYCFLALQAEDQLPLFFLVESQVVAEYLKWQHQFWLAGDSTRNDSSMRVFRIPVEDPENYQNNWRLFRVLNHAANKLLQLTAIQLRFIAATELWRYICNPTTVQAEQNYETEI